MCNYICFLLFEYLFVSNDFFNFLKNVINYCNILDLYFLEKNVFKYNVLIWIEDLYCNIMII